MHLCFTDEIHVQTCRVFDSAAGAVAKGSNGRWDGRSHGGSGTSPPAAAAKQGPAAAFDTARPAAERAGRLLLKITRARGATAGAPG